MNLDEAELYGRDLMMESARSSLRGEGPTCYVSASLGPIRIAEMHDSHLAHAIAKAAKDSSRPGVAVHKAMLAEQTRRATAAAPTLRNI